MRTAAIPFVCSVWSFIAVAASFLGIVACSANADPQRGEATDASVAPKVTAKGPAAIETARTLALPDSEITEAIIAADGAWREDNGRSVSSGWREANRGVFDRLGARLPASARDAFEVGIGQNQRLRLALTPEGANSASISLHDGHAYAVGAYQSTDLVWTASADRFEELFVLRDSRAPTSFTWDVERSELLKDAQFDDAGNLLFLDTNGRPVIRIRRPFVLDMHGARRDAQIDWASDRLRVSFDPEGLAYPILLDPVLEVFSWFKAATTPAAMARHWAGLAYDSNTTRKVSVLFGGYNGADISDTWEWNGTAWAQKCTSCTPGTNEPCARRGPAMAFDSGTGRNRTVLFGGLGVPASSGTCPAASNAAQSDTWEWDGTSWAPKCVGCSAGTTAPPARYFAGMAYDQQNAVSVLFGGRSLTAVLFDTWAWNGTSWTQKCTTCTEGTTEPQRRLGPAMAYDSKRKVTVVYGGEDITTGTVYYDDAWEWNGTSWAQKCTSCTGTARADASMAYDSARGTTVIFGGRNSVTNSLADTWEYDGTSWSQRSPATAPSGRYGAAAAFDSGRGRVVVVGGNAAGTENAETWEYHTYGGACSSASQCDSGMCTDGVCCDDVCSTCQACNLSPTPGKCSSITNAEDPDNCKTTQYCNGSGTCTAKSADGVACTDATGLTCTNGHCVEGVCCDGACSGTCESCLSSKTGLTQGKCNPIPNGSDPDNECTDLGAAACSTDGSCNGARACRTYANGTPCLASSCASATSQTNAKTCNSGSCASNGTTACNTGYACVAGACKTSCSVESDCASGYHCNGSTCVAKLAQGVACSSTPECQTGLSCVESVCCDATCAGGLCYSCRSAYTGQAEGHCAAIPNGTDPRNGCTEQGQLSCGTDGQCDGAGACRKYASGSVCIAGTCTSATSQSGASTCQSGTCTTGGNMNCNTGYACVAGACQTSCADDTACSSGYYCASNGTCQARKAQGAACNLGAGQDCKTGGCRACSTGNCSDGVCCDTACAGACDVCSASLGASADGTCTVAALGYSGNPSCGFYVCDGIGKTCITQCNSDSNCAATYYCAADHTCKPRKAQGQACDATAGVDCLQGSCRVCSGTGNGQCVDGYCCDTACSGSCDACNGAAKGWTNAVNGTCALAPKGFAGTPSCGVNLCTGSSASCGTTCTSDSDCAASAYCRASDGTCQPDQAIGATCSNDSQCALGHCVDGVCCDSGCTGLCEACSAAKKGAGADGVCEAVASGLDPDDDCAPDGTQTCQKDGSCDGTGKCRLYVQGTSCGNTSCQGNLVKGQICDGIGNCVTDTKGVDCAPYVCDMTAGQCKNPCTTDADCLTGNYCAANAECQPKKPQSAQCSNSKECDSSYCVDGVCCDSDCKGQCQACDLPSSVGTCTVVTGTPHGTRAACTAAGATCGGTCDGTDGAACTYPGATKVCNTTCTDGKETVSSCDGQGTCKTGTPKACAGNFACDAATNTCKQLCTVDADCTTVGYICDANHKCSPKPGPKCDGDHTIKTDGKPDQDCTPYKCSGSSCLETCTSIDQCVSPNLCDSTGHCVPPATTPPAKSADHGGCGCRVADDGSTSRLGWALALGALCVAARRRRRAA